MFVADEHGTDLGLGEQPAGLLGAGVDLEPPRRDDHSLAHERHG
jgi:hypothetical protein